MTGNKDISAKRNSRGFSLMELLVVIMIIAVLTTIGLIVGDKVMSSTKKKKTAANMQLIMHAIERFQEEFIEYPGDITLSFGRTRTCADDQGTSNMSLTAEMWGFTERPSPYVPPKSRDILKGLPDKVEIGRASCRERV